MKDISLKRTFNPLSKNFKQDSFDLGTVARLVEEIRDVIPNLTKNEFELLMDIPLSVLKMDVDLKNEKTWAKENSEYFCGCISLLNDDSYFNCLKLKFEKSEFELKDIYKLAEYIRNNYEELIKKYGRRLEPALRIIDVTIREDVELINNDNFYASGNIFGEYIDKAINL